MKNFLLMLIVAMIMVACGDNTSSTSTDASIATKTENEAKASDNISSSIKTSEKVELQKGRWTINDRQYEFVKDGRYLKAKMVEVPETSKALPHLNKTQISEVKYDPAINGWRGRYELFEMEGKYVCTIIPQNGDLLVTVNTPSGERSGIWARMK